VAALVAVLVCVPRLSRADVASCTALHASGQREARAGRLKHASEQFLTCASTDHCPDAVRAECVDLYSSVQKVIPTVMFTATDEQGRDITDVKVYSTDQLVVESLTGRPVQLDPGKHHFRFMLPGGDVRSSDVLVREGEKNRVVGIQVKGSASAGVRASIPPATSRRAPPAPPASTGRSLPAGFWVASSIGVASLASWGVFAVLGHDKQSALKACSPSCGPANRSDYDGMRRDYLIADISLGAAAVSVGLATWLFLSANPGTAQAQKRGESAATRIAVLPLPGLSGATLLVNASGF
jgi:hypothetical protein